MKDDSSKIKEFNLLNACIKGEKKKQALIDQNIDPNELNFLGEERIDMINILYDYGYNLYSATDVELCDFIHQLYPEEFNVDSEYRELYENPDNLFELPKQYNSKSSQKFISFIKVALYDYHQVDFRKFKPENAIYLLRWIGEECGDFISNLIQAKFYDNEIYDNCLGRWKFLHKVWYLENLLFFINFDEAAIILDNNKNKYIIRLSATSPGKITIQFWDWNKQKSIADRFLINDEGNIVVNNKVFKTIREFDHFIVNLYNTLYLDFINLGIAKPLISIYTKDENDNYNNLPNDYSNYY